MSDDVAVVRDLLAAMDAGDEARVRELVAPDFSTVPASTGVPMGLDAWLDAHAQLHAAFPGLKRNPGDFAQEGDKVFVTLHISVLNDRPVSIPALGIEELPPTGEVLRPTPHRDTFTLRDGKVISVHSDMPPGAGLQGMLEQIRRHQEDTAP